MISFPKGVGLDQLAIAVKRNLLARKSLSAVMAVAVVAIDAMAVEMTANAAVEAMQVLVEAATKKALASPVRPCAGFRAHAKSCDVETDVTAQMDRRKWLDQHLVTVRPKRVKVVCDPHPPWRHPHPLRLRLPPCRKETSVGSILATGVAGPTIGIASASAGAIDVTEITSVRVAAALEALGTVSAVDRALMMALTVDAA